MVREGRFPALAYTAYRTYLTGASLSQIGSQIQTWAIAWHVYQMTGSSLMVGLLGAIRVGPILMFSLLGGVAADQLDRRKIMLATQSCLALIALTLAALTVADRVELLHIYVAVAIYGGARAFDTPARQALLASLVPRRAFPSAITLNSVGWRLSDVLGPLITGLLIGAGGLSLGRLSLDGISACYVASFVCFFAVILVVLRLPARPLVLQPGQERIRTLAELKAFLRDGFRFVRRTPVVRSSMWIDFWATFFSSADALLPAFAGPILRLGGRGYGLLAASVAAGSLLAAVTMAAAPTFRRQGAWVIYSVGAYGLFTVLFGVSQSLLAAVVFLAGTGAADTVSTVLRQTIRNLATPDHMRGRMTAIGMLLHISGPQLGDFEAGVVARAFGERWSVAIGGMLSLIVAGHWLRVPPLRDYRHSEEPERAEPQRL